MSQLNHNGVDSLFANQSVTIRELLSAFQNLLEKCTGFDPRRVVHWHQPNRPSVDNPGPLVWYHWLDSPLDDNTGPNRYGRRANHVFEVNITTRAFYDGNMRDPNILIKHLTTRALIENAFEGNMLFESYNKPVGFAPPMPTRTTPLTEEERQARWKGDTGVGPVILTVAAMGFVKLPAPDRPRPEQGYIESRLGISVPAVLRVSTNDFIQLGEEDASGNPSASQSRVITDSRAKANLSGKSAQQSAPLSDGAAFDGF